jgi:hypothetical protein
MLVIGLTVCLWTDRRVQARLSAKSKSDQQRIEKQSDTIVSLAKENSELQEQARKRQLLKEAKPGVFYLGPGNSNSFSR